jgi:hypothetical protein
VELGGVGSTWTSRDVEVEGRLVYLADGIRGLRVFDFGPEYRGTLAVEIDIRPESASNIVAPGSRGLIPVALLGSASFDVASVDPFSLAFGPAGAPVVSQPRPHRVDVNDDGWPDLVLRYRSDETGIAVGDVEACLSGELTDGGELAGCDAVRTTPGCGLGFEVALLLPLLRRMRLWRGRRH